MKKLTNLIDYWNRKASRNLAVGLLMAIGSSTVFAQTITTSLATGTNTTANIPIHGNYDYSYSQQIYLATDFDVAVAGTPNYITKIRFFYVSGNFLMSNNWTIYMGNTATASFASNSAWIPLASLTEVFSGILPSPVANSWLEITLDTPFLWDGVSNVVVAIDENAPGYSNINWRRHDTGANRSLYVSRDVTDINPASPSGLNNSRFSYVPQTQFVHTPVSDCAGVPNHTTANASPSSVCSNSPIAVDFSATGGSFFSGLSYQWQYNDGSGWLDFPTGTAATFSTVPSTTVNVRLVTTCLATGDEDISEETSVVVNPAPTVTTDYTSVAYCSGDPAVLVASGADSYAWSPATGLNNANTDLVIASPVNPTTYSVVGTDLMGCKDTATVFVTPLSKMQRTASYSPTTLCEPGTPVMITASASPATIFGGSTYEYRFIAADGSILQDWSATNTYSFTPGADSVFKVYTDFRSNFCSDAVDSISTSVIVGFGADVMVDDYDCLNLGGTVTLNDLFGQPEVETVFSNPFANTSDVTSAVALYGSAAIVDGRALLTPSATGVSGAVVIDDPAFHTGLNNAMTVSFKMTADQPINIYGTGGADGVSYSFGNDVSNTGNQNGSGSKLRLSFDANDNSPNMAGIYLAYNVSGTLSPTGIGTLIHVGDINLWKLKQDVPVVFTINTSGKASLTVDGTTVFENVQMPAAYMAANTSGWRHVFGAATGGDAMRQAIKDVVITAPSLKFALTPTAVAPTTWDATSVFTGIQPGIYDVWISSNGSASCGKKVETIEVVNTNPLVLLGNDTTICEGESLVLDAGNPGSTYVWSNSQITTQTREVTQAGPYVVNVTAPNGCVGVGSIYVSVMNAPTASTIYVEDNAPSYTFTVLNPQSVNTYSWDFGDGTTVSNGPPSISHTFATSGPRMVSVTLTNECGTETVVTTIVVPSTASLNEYELAGVTIYPNPASDLVHVALDSDEQATIAVYSLNGSLVYESQMQTLAEISVKFWNKGVYFVHVSSENKKTVQKLLIH